jgi:cytochrome c oxidase subunit III
VDSSVHVHQQFQDIDQQTNSATLGMWTFLATEIVFFGVLFATYTIYRVRWPEAFRHGSQDLKLWIGGINTAVLLTSSLFMALAVRAAALGNNRFVMIHLGITIALGVVFLGFKATEYVLEAREHLVPGINFTTIAPDEVNNPPQEQHPRPREQRLFMLFYFIMTGLHATHMIVGIGVMATLIVLTRRGHYSREYHTPIEIAGLYWHFVDIVWVFLYPALYLLRQA